MLLKWKLNNIILTTTIHVHLHRCAHVHIIRTALENVLKLHIVFSFKPGYKAFH